ncbi:hypothetical protein NW768_009246 [Fusarium equiseti]|uniref:Uncharacterized protein n=1 Tax=Fusarium equiseti TaxID=61235 RepID=A0ABQ8R3R0_FUSEQ|nr:hypothetical protein NW768_009246 [Fusarium equiseti]
MSAPKNEQDVAVDWDYDKMTNGVNVKFPPLDSSDVPRGHMSLSDLEDFGDIWNKHSRHWDVQDKIEIFDHLWNRPIVEPFPWTANKHPLYPERSKFSTYVILKWLYPDDYDMPPHRFIRWGKYPAIYGDEHQVANWDGIPVPDWGNAESPAQGHQCSDSNVEAVNEGVRNSVQDESDESLKTKNEVIAHHLWWNTKDAPLSPALNQQNNNNADDPSEDVIMPGTWVDQPVCNAWHGTRSSHHPLGKHVQHYQRQERSEWGSDDEKYVRGPPAANRVYAAADSKDGRSKEMAHQETSAEDDGGYDEWPTGNPYFVKGSVENTYPSSKAFDAFASKFSSETEDSEVGVITPASSNAEQAPALSDQQIQELKDFITKANENTTAHLSLEISRMEKSLDMKIERMREDFNLRLNRAMKVNRSLRDDMESIQLSLLDSATTRKQVRELRAKVADLEQSTPAF